MHGVTKLLLSNIPADCADEHLRRWIEGRGYRTLGLRVIRDLVSGTSPSFAYVQLIDASKLDECAQALDGQTLLGHDLHVAQVFPRALK